MDIALVIDGNNTNLEVLREGQLFVSVSLAWWFSASFAAWLDAGPLPVVFSLVVDPLAFARAVFPTPPILFSILGFMYHSIFWLFHNPGWEVPDICWLSLSGLPFGCVGFLR